MPIICPKCGHVRSDNDDPLIPDWKCPSCGLIYTKFPKSTKDLKIISEHAADGPANFIADETPASLEHSARKTFRKSMDISLSQSIAITAAIIIASWLLVANWLKISAYLYWPIDRQPEITFEKILDPKKQKELRIDLCNWAKREEIRHPGLLNKAKRESSCKPL